MLTFHGKQEIKDFYLARVVAHEKADEIIKGTYWENGKGCAVGCTIEGDQHSKYEKELGIPIIMAYLEDSIFEGLPNDVAKTFPRRFLAAIDVGLNVENGSFSLVLPRFLHWNLVDPEHGIIKYAKTDRTKDAILNVSKLLEKKIQGKKTSKKQWKAAAAYAADAADAAAYAAYAYAAADAAYAAYAYAAADAADAAYAYAAADAAYAAYAAYAYAAYAAAYAADAAAYAADAAYKKAREKRYILMSEKLLELLAEAK